MSELVTTGGDLLPTLGRPLDQSPAAVYLAGLASGSRRTMGAALDVIAARLSGGRADALTMPWGGLRFQHTAAIRSELAGAYSPATARKMLSALRGVLRAARRLGQMGADDYAQAVDLDPIKGERLPTGRNLTPGEIAAMFTACAGDPSPAGVRDAALLALLQMGLRRAEVAGLQIGDLDQAAVKVKGKGDKQRAVPLSEGAAEAIADWLTLRGDGPGPLLLEVKKGGRIVRRGLTAQAIYNALGKRADQAGVNNVTPHDWRRTFAGDLLDAGADLSVVQKLMGHASPETTSRYDRRGDEAKRRAVGLLHTPYRRRTLAGLGR